MKLFKVDTKNIFDYQEALELVQPHIKALKSKKKIKSFCEEHELSYRSVQHLYLYPEKPKPDLLVQILELFGYTAQKQIVFKVNK